MRDIVATVQAEQDEIIRLDDSGVVVIEGGPGTGKTAVALHRVAYLLYTRREALSRSGVLVIGPTRASCTTSATCSPPSARPASSSPPRTARAGDPAGRRGLPRRPPGQGRHRDGRGARGGAGRSAARAGRPDRDRTRRPDRAAGPRAGRARAPARQGQPAAAQRGPCQLPGRGRRGAHSPCGWADGPTLADLFDLPASAAGDLTGDLGTELADSDQLDAELEELWPLLTPEELLAELLSDPERLATAAAELSDDDRAALLREDGEVWTVADIPLLDEAAELLGQDDADLRKAADREERERIAYAEGVLAILDTEEDPDEETLRAVDLLGSGDLAERQTERDTRDLAERAAADRQWTYGHVVVDEAQELSDMDWRVLMRRCPSRSLTIVGDLAQRESPPAPAPGPACSTATCRSVGRTASSR